jgi:RHS repeat-associated protein
MMDRRASANLQVGLRLDEFFTRTDHAGLRALLPDALGSTLALADSTGAVSTQYTYEPFGAAVSVGAVSTNSFQFTGRENDGTGLSYYRARYYGPAFGRFLSEDQARLQGASKPGTYANLYPYAADNPILLRDPLGLQSGHYYDLGFNIPSGLLPGVGVAIDIQYSPSLDCVNILVGPYFGMPGVQLTVVGGDPSPQFQASTSGGLPFPLKIVPAGSVTFCSQGGVGKICSTGIGIGTPGVAVEFQFPYISTCPHSKSEG